MPEAQVIVLADYVSRRYGGNPEVATGQLFPIRRLPAFDQAIAYLYERERAARKRVAQFTVGLPRLTVHLDRNVDPPSTLAGRTGASSSPTTRARTRSIDQDTSKSRPGFKRISPSPDAKSLGGHDMGPMARARRRTVGLDSSPVQT